MNLEQGTKLGQGGKYVLVQKLGQGGTGEVWRATNTALGQDVAIKRLRPMLVDGELQAEARKIALLTFTGIVRVYDVVEHDSAVFLVEELIEGRTLHDMLLDHQGKGTWPSHEQSLSLLVRILESVRFSHGKGIIHRDLTPKNIMVTNLGDPKIIDFGLARAHEELLDSKDSLAIKLTVGGTANWMAPEQVAGRPVLASDLFAVGLIGYLLFTKTHPFVDPTGLALARDRIASAHQFRNPREIDPTIPRHVEGALVKLLQHSASDRYASAADAILDLEPPKIRCEKCDAELRSKSKYCDECGERVKQKTEVAEGSPASAAPDSVAADAISQRGYFKTRQGDLEGGIEDYRAAIKRDPNHARAFQNLGWALNRLGRYDEAIEALNRAVALEPANPNHFKYRSYSHQQLDNDSEAEKDLTHALTFADGDSELLYLRARSRARLKDTRGAMDDLDRILALDPTDDRALELKERLGRTSPFNPIRSRGAR